MSRIVIEQDNLQNVSRHKITKLLAGNRHACLYICCTLHTLHYPGATENNSMGAPSAKAHPHPKLR